MKNVCGDRVLSRTETDERQKPETSAGLTLTTRWVNKWKNLWCLLGLPVTKQFLSFFFFKQYGRNALEIVMKSIVKLDSPLVSPPLDFKGDFFKGTASVALNHLELFSVSHLWVMLFFFCRNSGWFNRCGPHKCGGHVRHINAWQRYSFFIDCCC